MDEITPRRGDALEFLMIAGLAVLTAAQALAVVVMATHLL